MGRAARDPPYQIPLGSCSAPQELRPRQRAKYTLGRTAPMWWPVPIWAARVPMLWSRNGTDLKTVRPGSATDLHQDSSERYMR